MSAEVLAYGLSHFALCLECAWRSGPQEGRSDACDRAVTHDYFNHKDSLAAERVEREHAARAPYRDDDPRLLSGEDESILRALEAAE